MNYKLLSENQAENVRSKFEQAFIMMPPEYETHYKNGRPKSEKIYPVQYILMLFIGRKH